MIPENIKIWIFRFTAFFWTFSLTLLFRYSLDRLYPFWTSLVSLGFFAFSLVFTVWAAYSLATLIRRTTSSAQYIFAGINIINMIVFFVFLARLGELEYLYSRPSLYTLQIFILFFVFSFRLKIVLPHQVSLVAGTAMGFFAAASLGAHVGAIFICFLISVAPLQLLGTAAAPRLGSKERMLPLRYPFDFIRYLLLGLSLLSVLDQHRHRFYIILALLAIGPIFQFVALHVDKKKHHIKYGIRALAILFIIMAAAYFRIPLSYWAAAAYSGLTIWEALYFKKSVSGFSNRELAMSGVALLVVLLLHFISFDWGLIISGLIITAAQFGFLLYLFKRHRPWISALFMISIITWSLVLALHYKDAYRREFWSPPTEPAIPPPASLAWFTAFPDAHHVYTNLFPKEVLEKAPRFSFFEAPSFYLTKALAKNEQAGDEAAPAIVIYNTDHQRPYGKEPGISFLKQYLGDHNKYWVYLYSFHSPGLYWSVTRGEQMSPIPGLDAEPPPPEKIALFYEIGIELATWYHERRHYDYALQVYTDLLYYSDNATLRRKIAEINGILQNTSQQIFHLEKLVSTKSATIEEEILLMELYFYTENLDASLAAAERLFLQDSKNRIDYLEWIFRISRQTGNRWDWQRLHRRVEYWKENDPGDDGMETEIRYEALLTKIGDLIESNPLLGDVSAEEKKRQERVRLPE